MPDEERRKALLDLVELRVPVEVAVDAVRSIDWDRDADLVVLTTADARRVLQRLLVGLLGPSAVERWAEALECREDIGREAGASDALDALVFELANPLICRPLDRSLAEEWLARLA